METHDFSLEVHVLASTLVPIVSTTLGGSAAKRCSTNLVHMLDTTRTDPQVR
jgi:hypothetical protein